MYEALRRGSAQATLLKHAGQVPTAQITEAKPSKSSIKWLGWMGGAALVGAIIASAFFYLRQMPVDNQSSKQSMSLQHTNSALANTDGIGAQASVSRNTIAAISVNSMPQPLETVKVVQPAKKQVIEIDRGDQKIASTQLDHDSQNFASDGGKKANYLPTRVAISREKAAVQSSEIAKRSAIHEVALVASKASVASPNGVSDDTKVTAPTPTLTLATAQTSTGTKTQIVAGASVQTVQTLSAAESGNLADQFDLMNREISKGNLTAAAKHLINIQVALPVTSISRMRAEGWLDFHQGNLDSAGAVYRKILTKIPSDEHALSVMQSIDRRTAASNNLVK